MKSLVVSRLVLALGFIGCGVLSHAAEEPAQELGRGAISGQQSQPKIVRTPTPGAVDASSLLALEPTDGRLLLSRLNALEKKVAVQEKTIAEQAATISLLTTDAKSTDSRIRILAQSTDSVRNDFRGHTHSLPLVAQQKVKMFYTVVDNKNYSLTVPVQPGVYNDDSRIVLYKHDGDYMKTGVPQPGAGQQPSK